MIDVQKGFEDAGFWGRRDKPAAEANIATLIRTGVTRTAPSSSPDGEVVTAEELTRATAASLHHGGFARVVRTADLMTAFATRNTYRAGIVRYDGADAPRTARRGKIGGRRAMNSPPRAGQSP